MDTLKFNFPVTILFFLPIFQAGQLPININKGIIRESQPFSAGARQFRDNGGPTYHAPHQQTSSIFNILNTHGIGLSASIGAGFRYANADSHQNDHPENTPAPSSSSVFDRYIGSTWHIGLNSHLGNNKQGHEGIAQQANGGALPIFTQQDDERRSDIEITTSKPQIESLWERINKYFPWNRLMGRKCEKNDADGINCDNPHTNVFTRLFTRYFVRETPRSENRLLNDPNDNENFFSKINSFMEYVQKNKNMEARQMASIKNDLDVFRNTFKYYLLERFSAFITQNTTNEPFLYKMVKNNLLHMMNNGEPLSNTKTDNELLTHLSRYFTNERIRKLFPDIEILRKNLLSQKMQSENEFSNWFKDNVYYLTSHSAVSSTERIRF